MSKWTGLGSYLPPNTLFSQVDVSSQAKDASAPFRIVMIIILETVDGRHIESGNEANNEDYNKNR